MDLSGLGHSNEKQKLQYHLRLKLQLEQMRHQCLVILRERFQLEQCIRWAAPHLDPVQLCLMGHASSAPCSSSPVLTQTQQA